MNSPARRTVEEVASERGMSQRDCRACPQFEPQGDGLGYGWCRAHRQFVKLYQMSEGFWSQCQFKALTRDRGSSPSPAEEAADHSAADREEPSRP